MTKTSQETLFVGVDVAKATLEVALSDQRATETFANDKVGIAALLKRLKPLNVTLVLMEATGGFERQLAHSLLLAGFAVIVANPRHAHYFVLGLGHLAKTDRIDAKALARFARTLYESEDFEQRLLALPSAEQQALDALVTRRTQLVGMRTAERNRLYLAPTLAEKSIQVVIKLLDKPIKALDSDQRLDKHFKDKRDLLSRMRERGVKRSCFTFGAATAKRPGCR